MTEEQKPFINDQSVAEFLADDDDHPTFTSYAVCDGETVVGLACYGQELEHEEWRWWVPLVVIDDAIRALAMVGPRCKLSSKRFATKLQTPERLG